MSDWRCIAGEHCNCGGDTAAVRATCPNYRPPLPPCHESGPVDPVKTLRDEFAMAALTAFLQRPIVAADRHRAIKNMGAESYEIADAMLKARSS